MKARKNIKFYTRMREARLKQLREAMPLVSGSLVTIARRCGRAGCWCREAEGHPGYYLTYRRKGKTATLYVPVGLYGEVEKWVKEYKRIKRLLGEISELQRLIIRRWSQESRRARTKKPS